MELLVLKQAVKKARSEGWPMSKVELEINALFDIADAAREVVYEIDRMLSLGEVPQLKQITYWRDRLRDPAGSSE